MGIRLIAIDLDGTILDSDHKVHPTVPQAISNAQSHGIQVCLATGRFYNSAKLIADHIGIESPMVCSNGSQVVQFDGSEIQYTFLDPEVARITLEFAVINGLHVSAYSEHGVYLSRGTAYVDEYKSLVAPYTPRETEISKLFSQNLFKLVIIDEPERISGHHAELVKRLRGLPAEMTESAPKYLEILPLNSNKGRGVQILSEWLGVEQSEVAAIGDYRNDLEMIRWAGLSAAVGNAIPLVKESADFVVGSNTEGGVAEFINNFVLQTV